jgi:hypothetical protein
MLGGVPLGGEQELAVPCFAHTNNTQTHVSLDEYFTMKYISDFNMPHIKPT